MTDTHLDRFDWGRIASDLDAYGAAVAPEKHAARRRPGDRRALSRRRCWVPLDRRDGRATVLAAASTNISPSRRPTLSANCATTSIRGSPRSPTAGTRRWAFPARFPAEHKAFRAECRAAGQTRPTPLMLRYGAGDYNCLHQDVYGALWFPLQVAILLSAPGRDFSGGEFVLTEQRPRMQSRAEVVSLGQGDGGDLRRARPAGAGRAREVRVGAPPRRQPHQERRALHPRDHLPRRGVRVWRRRAGGA